MNGGTIKSNGNSSTSYGIYNTTGTIEIVNGTIDIVGKSNSYGVYSYNYSSGGTIIIGTKGGEVNTESPEIIATKTSTSTSPSNKGIGVYNLTGTNYFYDGIIKGNTIAIEGTLKEIEENTALSGDIKVATELYLTTDIPSVAKIVETGNEYKSLQDAIDACSTSAGNNQTTIQLLRNINLFASDGVIDVKKGQNIILDLQGYMIISGEKSQEEIMQNSGTLEITDTTENSGTIKAATYSIIKNNENATLKLKNVNIICDENGSSSKYKKIVINEGELNIDGATVSSEEYYICGIYNVGKMTMTDGSISNVNKSTYTTNSYGIHNLGTALIEGGTIDNITTGNSYGIYNDETGELQVTGGTISATTYNSNNNNNYKCCGIYNIGEGKIIIGAKENGVESIDLPKIEGTTSSNNFNGYGIYNPSGTLEFYDGVIEGKTQAVYGNVAYVEENTELLMTGIEKLQLQEVSDKAVSVNGTRYTSLQEAIDASPDNTETTIQIQRDTVQPGGVIGSNKNIVLDLNGHKLTEYSDIENYGTLKVIDSTGANAGSLTSATGTAITSEGNTEIAGGTLTGNAYGVNGNVTMTGGVVTDNTYGLYGTVTVSGGTISNNQYGVYATGDSSVTGAVISGNENGVYTYSGTTEISNATFENNTSGAAIGGGTLNVKAGTVSGNTYGINAAGGRVNIGINDGVVTSAEPTIIGENSGVQASGSATIALYDGIIKGKTASVSGFISETESNYMAYDGSQDGYYVTYLVRSGTVSTVAVIGGVEYTSLQAAVNACMEGEETTITLVNGTNLTTTLQIPEKKKIILDISGFAIRTSSLDVLIENAGELTIIDSDEEETGNITSESGIAIENTGTLTIGQDDETISKTIPLITGKTAVKTEGTFNFYDGLLRGTETVIDGTVTSTPSGASVTESEANGYKQNTLE